jgi:hypothetical protein
MADRRREQRLHAELRVKGSGVDACCTTFSEYAIATNISGGGALLLQIRTELRCGDMLIVEYGHHRAHFRIVWILDTGIEGGSRVAIYRVGTHPCPWEELLAGETVKQ